MPHFRIKSKDKIPKHLNETPSSKITEATVPKRSKAKDDTAFVHEFKLKGPTQVKLTKKLSFLEKL